MELDMEDHPIHPAQHGFTKGKCTESAISKTIDYIEQQLFKPKHHCLGIFLDISSAFDSISIDHILDRLLAHNGTPDMVEWYYSYLGRRYLEVELHGETVHLTTATGFPQGGVCSAKFWLIAFDEAIRIINSEGITGNGYADDCSALIGGTHYHNLIEKMQTMLDKLVRWGNSCGLRFNPQKTVVIMFTRSTKPFTRQVRMNGDLIPYSHSVVYLGVTLDAELRWTEHIHNKIKKAKGLLMKMSSITRNYWGPKPKLIRWAYTGIVRPVISYAALVWGGLALEDDDIIDNLRRLNRLAMNTMVSVPRSTPTQAMEIILDVMPLHLHIKKEGLSTYLRIQDQLLIQWEGVFSNRTRSVSHLRYWDYLANDTGMYNLQAETDECNVLRPQCHFTLDTSSFVDMENSQQPLECNVYTDGSKLGGKVGAGVYIKRSSGTIATNSYRLPDESTVYQAEVMAIKQAALTLATIPDLTTIKFYVDSQAALRTFQSTHIKSKLALDTIRKLNLIKHSMLVFVWTKAHIGIPGNEEADELAKAGTVLDDILDVLAPACGAKNAVDHGIRDLWQKEWVAYPKARQSKIFHPRVDKNLYKSVIIWNKLQLSRYIRAVTGHNNLLYHVHNIDNDISEICRFCLEEREEFQHLAFSCPALWWERQTISAMDPEHSVPEEWTPLQTVNFTFFARINDAFVRPLFQTNDTRDFMDIEYHLGHQLPQAQMMTVDSDTDQSVMDVSSLPDSSSNPDSEPPSELSFISVDSE